jgi:hypothetical protein
MPPLVSPGAARLGLIAGLAALILYAATGSRGVEWQDPGIHQYRIVTGQLEHPFGLALSHPLQYWLGRAALHVPLGDPLHRLNLVSAIFGAVGVGMLTGLVLRLTRSPLAASLAGATLGLTHAYWQMSALTETYTIAAALLIAEWACLLRYVRTRQPVWLLAVFACNGLHVADHLLGLLPLATYGVLLLERIIRRRLAARWLLAAAAVWLVAASPYWTLVVQHWQRTGDAGETVRSALFGGSARSPSWGGDVLNVRPSAAQVKLAGMTFGYCFPSAAGLLALVGLLRRVHSRRRVFRWVLLAQTLIIVVFVGRYTIKDLYTFFLPVCALTALWAGLGVAWLLRRFERGAARRWLVGLLVANALLPVVVYYCFPIVAKQRGWLGSQLPHIAFRDAYTHFFRPWRFDQHSAEEFSRAALAATGAGGWLLADSTTAYTVAVTYLVYGGPPDVRVYWWRDCLTDRNQPRLTDEELLARVEQNGRVLGVPSTTVENVVRPPLVIERTEPFWQVRVEPGSSR